MRNRLESRTPKIQEKKVGKRKNIKIAPGRMFISRQKVGIKERSKMTKKEFIHALRNI